MKRNLIQWLFSKQLAQPRSVHLPKMGKVVREAHAAVPSPLEGEGRRERSERGVRGNATRTSDDTPHPGLAALARPSPSRGEGISTQRTAKNAKFFHNNPLCALCALLCVLCVNPFPSQAGEHPPDPELERATFKVADGFEVNLFAADPNISKPIQMNFDAQGRLWVVSSSIYPQIKPGEIANDKVVILEDTNGDGKADKSTVFADGLLIPTGIEIGDGGAYVANSIEIDHLSDTNGDGKADKKRIVLSGFGTEDTHHIIHTFRWGYDGEMYFNQSIYIHSHVETPHGTKRLLAGGVWRFRPETMQLEIFDKGLVNSWGHTWDRWGTNFGTDGAGGEGINYRIPGAHFVTHAYPGFPILKGLNPGSPKYCGAELVNGRHLPEDWQGNIVTNDFRANRVVRFAISEDGTGYAAKLMPDVIRSTDKAFRPIDVKIGPDGAIYIADWYNPIINHGEVDFYDPRRDRTHGRIWRLSAKGRPLVERPQLANATIPQLLDFLKAPEDWTRHFAKRVLKERKHDEVKAALDIWVAKQTLGGAQKTEEVYHNLLEALWTYQTIDVPQPKLLDMLLNAAVPQARAAAVRVLCRWKNRIPNAVELLMKAVTDDFPRVRLEAVRALAEIPSPSSVEIALRALDKGSDRFLDYALTITLIELKDIWLPAFQDGKLAFDNNNARIEFALKAVKSAKGLKPLIDKLKAGQVASENVDGVLDLVASVGGPEELNALFEMALNEKSNAITARRYLNALLRAAKLRNARPAGTLARLSEILDLRHFNTIDEAAIETHFVAIRLGAAWKLEEMRKEISKMALDGHSEAFEALVDLGGQASIDILVAMTNLADRRSYDTRVAAAVNLAKLDLKRAAKIAVDLLLMDIGDANATTIFNAFLQRKGGVDVLLSAIPPTGLAKDTAKLGLRALQSVAIFDGPLHANLAKFAGVDSEPRELKTDQMKEVLARVAKADPVRGEAIFRRNESMCLKCHAIGGAGGQVGPDLQSLSSAPQDYIVDSLLTPNKAVKEGFHSINVTTKDGQFLTGIKVRQGQNDIVIRDANGEETTIGNDNMAAPPRNSGSIMPAGLTAMLTQDEFADLVRFLSELGKGNYSAANTQVVRRWFAEEKINGRPYQATVHSEVSGVLPLSAFSANEASCKIEVTTPGTIKLLLNSTAGLSLSADGKDVPVSTETIVDLAKGTHTMTFKIDRTKRKEGLRVELGEVAGSLAKAHNVSK